VPVTLTATLLAASDPKPVQVALNGTTAGQVYEITGTSSDGSRWPVSGGIGVSVGSQVVLTDNRTSLNSVITYEALVDGATYTSASVTVESDDVAVLQTISGLIVVGVDVASTTEPRTAPTRSSTFDIAGREDPAARLDIPGSYTYTWQLDTEVAGSAVMESILRSGSPVVRRLQPGMRDLKTVVIGIVLDWSDELLNDGLDTWRRWSLKVRETGDPQPSAALIAYTWPDFDAAFSGGTWAADFDSAFATWDEFDRTDWAIF
jgi:hypothetical protein